MGTFVIAGFWIASAVLTAGWTWDAFTKTYDKFPDTQADAAVGVNTLAEGQKLGESAVQKIPLIGNALEKAGQFLGSITGTEANLNPQQISRLQRLPKPPARITSQLKTTYQQSGGLTGTRATPQANKAFQGFYNWASSKGWQPSDMEAYLTLLFPHTTWKLR